MESPTKRTILRLTPIPDPDPQKSLIIKLLLPNSKKFLKYLDSPSPNPDSDYLPGQRINKHSTQTKQRPKSLQSLVQKPSTPHQATGSSLSATSPYQPDFPSSPASSVSSVPGEPENRPTATLNALRVDAARDIVTILYTWGRHDIKMELYETIALQNVPSDEARLLQKKIWVRECLRSRYKVWIQSCETYSVEEHRTRWASTKKDNEPGMECEYPGCGKRWERGEYRVSFEPREWTESGKVVKTMANKEEGSTAKQETDEDDEPVIGLPDYHKLMTPQNIYKYGRGEFYCLRCFEKLLETTNPSPALPFLQKKRKRVLPATDKYSRPSPLCRTYASVFAETRVHAEGKFLLDATAAEVVRRWKDRLFEEGIKGIMEQFGGLFKESEELEVKIEDEDAELNVGEGKGLAELLVSVKEARDAKGSRAGQGRKKKKF